MSLTIEDFKRIGAKKSKLTAYPYAVKTKYGKQMKEEFVPIYKPSGPRTLNTGANNNRPPVR
jgi:hypothetical protein